MSFIHSLLTTKTQQNLIILDILLLTYSTTKSLDCKLGSTDIKFISVI